MGYGINRNDKVRGEKVGKNKLHVDSVLLCLYIDVDII